MSLKNRTTFSSATPTVLYKSMPTSLGFVAAPAVVYYNYRAVTSAEVPAEYRPSKTLVAWNWVAFVAMIGFALGFFYLIVT